MANRSWWLRQIGLIVVGGFYFYFGIRMLVGAYSLNNPLVFMLFFFASNLIILISAALIVGFIYRLLMVFRQLKSGAAAEDNQGDSADNGNP